MTPIIHPDWAPLDFSKVYGSWLCVAGGCAALWQNFTLRVVVSCDTYSGRYRFGPMGDEGPIGDTSSLEWAKVLAQDLRRERVALGIEDKNTPRTNLLFALVDWCDGMKRDLEGLRKHHAEVAERLAKP